MSNVVLSLGMGVDSVGILTRWLTEPETRDFDLTDLVVLTAQVGAEYRETAEHMHIGKYGYQNLRNGYRRRRALRDRLVS